MGAIFPAPVQTGPGAYQASFLGVKRPGRGVDHPPPSIAEVIERVEPYIHSSFGPTCPALRRALTLLYRYLNMMLENTLYRDATPCSVVKTYRCLCETCCRRTLKKEAEVCTKYR